MSLAGWSADQHVVQVRQRPCGGVVIPGATVDERVEKWWIGRDAMQVKVPLLGDGANVVECFRVLEPAVEEHHGNVAVGAQCEVEDGEGVLSPENAMYPSWRLK